MAQRFRQDLLESLSQINSNSIFGSAFSTSFVENAEPFSFFGRLVSALLAELRAVLQVISLCFHISTMDDAIFVGMMCFSTLFGRSIFEFFPICRPSLRPLSVKLILHLRSMLDAFPSYIL